MPEKPLKLRGKHSIMVVELELNDSLSSPNRSLFWVTSTTQESGDFFTAFCEKSSQLKLPGVPVRVRPDLVLSYKPSRSKVAIARRKKETMEQLDKLGHLVFPHWRIYVLDVDPDHPEPLLNRGTRNHVVYVGQTSKTIEARLLEHQGLSRGKEGEYTGGQSIEGRSPRLNAALTPSRRVFSYEDALDFEAEYSKQLRADGYRVLGDGLTEPAKRRRPGRLASSQTAAVGDSNE
jgi:hypothetical protein